MSASSRRAARIEHERRAWHTKVTGVEDYTLTEMVAEELVIADLQRREHLTSLDTVFDMEYGPFIVVASVNNEIVTFGPYLKFKKARWAISRISQCAFDNHLRAQITYQICQLRYC